MMRQTAVLSGKFSGGVIGRKSRSVLNEDFYQERHSSSTGLDLLDPQSRKVRPQQNWQEPSYSSIPLLVDAQTFSNSLFSEEKALQTIIEEPGYHAQESLSDLLDNLQGTPRSTGSHLQGVRRFFPGSAPSLLSEDSRRIIGENGLRRFEEFKRYHAGWDYGRGKPLSSHSVTTLESFLRQLPGLAALEPSLFLTHEGNLQLGWEDAHGNVVELEFYPDRIEYYIESLNEEGTVELEALQQLVDKVRPTKS